MYRQKFLNNNYRFNKKKRGLFLKKLQELSFLDKKKIVKINKEGVYKIKKIKILFAKNGEMIIHKNQINTFL